MSAAADFIPVCDLTELQDNASRVVELDGRSILLCRSDGEVFAVENRCSHQNTPLAEGRVRRGYVICPLHGVRFELTTGVPVGQLTRIPIATFPVAVCEGKVAVCPTPAADVAKGAGSD